MGLYIDSPLRLQKTTYTTNLKDHVRFQILNLWFLIGQTSNWTGVELISIGRASSWTDKNSGFFDKSLAFVLDLLRELK